MWFRLVVASLGLVLITGSTLLAPPITGQLALILYLAALAALLWNLPFELSGGKATLVYTITVAGGLLYGTAQASIATAGGILIGLTIGRILQGERENTSAVQDVLEGLFQIGVITSALAPASLVYAGIIASGQGIGLATGAALLVYALLHGMLLFCDGWLRHERADAGIARGSRRLVLYELLPLPFIYIVVTSFQPAGLGSLILLGGMAVICAVMLNRLDTTHKGLIKATGDLALKEETNRILESIITTQKREVEAKDLITTTLVHDLRSPASAVLGAPYVLAEVHQKEQWEKDDLTDQAMKVARHSTQRLLNLIDSMMDIARSRVGRLDLTLGEVNLHKLAGSVLTEFMPQAREYGIMLQNEIMEATPMVRADQNKILRVLYNLVDNAIKFTPAGGQVVLSAEPAAQDMLAIHVRDTGPGVPEAYRDTIFDRFSQVPGSYGRQRGSGLGLTFCHLAVEANGGKIWVDQNPGGGSCFTFTLPLADQL